MDHWIKVRLDRWCDYHDKVHEPDEFGRLCEAWDDVTPTPRWWRRLLNRHRGGDS